MDLARARPRRERQVLPDLSHSLTLYASDGALSRNPIPCPTMPSLEICLLSNSRTVGPQDCGSAPDIACGSKPHRESGTIHMLLAKRAGNTYAF